MSWSSSLLLLHRAHCLQALAGIVELGQQQEMTTPCGPSRCGRLSIPRCMLAMLHFAMRSDLHCTLTLKVLLSATACGNQSVRTEAARPSLHPNRPCSRQKAARNATSTT